MKKLVLVLCLVFFASCANNSQPPAGGGEQTNQQTPAVDTSKQSTAVPAVNSAEDKGVGPIKEVKLKSIDKVLVEKGKKTFASKCSACHKLEKRYVGPALGDVTKRRKPEYIMNMILNPLEMTKKDPVAKELFSQFLTQMTFQNVTQDDARAILEYFRDSADKVKVVQ